MNTEIELQSDIETLRGRFTETKDLYREVCALLFFRYGITPTASKLYPNRYTAKAANVLPLLAGGPPAHRGPPIIGDDYVMPANWKGNVIFHQDKIEACPPDQVLTIDAWDQS